MSEQQKYLAISIACAAIALAIIAALVIPS